MVETRTGYRPLISAGALALLVVAVNISLMPSYMGDDAYIHCNYVRNVIDSGQVAYNSERPTYGSTSLLWVLVASMFAYITQEVPVTIRIVSAMVFLLNVLMFRRYLLRRLEASEMQVLLVVIILIGNAAAFRWMLTGMETNLVEFAVLAILFWYAPDRPVRSALFAVAAYLIRPEFLLLIPAHAGASIFYHRRLTKGLALYGVIVSGFFFALLAFNGVYFGSYLPLTTIKAGTGFSLDSLVRLATVVAGTYPVELLSLCVLVVLGWKSNDMRLRLTRNEVLVALFALLVIIFYAVRGTSVISRYLSLLHIAIVLFVALYTFRATAARWLPYLAGLILTTQIALFATLHYPGIVEFTSGFQTTYREIGSMLRVRSAADTSSVMIADVGVVPFYSHRPVIDLGGLTSTHIYDAGSLDPVEIASRYRPGYYVMKTRVGQDTSSMQWFVGHVQGLAQADVMFRREIGRLGVLDPKGWVVTVLKLRYSG